MTSIAHTLNRVSPKRFWLRLTPVQRRVLSWLLLFIAVVILFWAIVREPELRSFDVVFWPMTALFFIVTLGLGWMLGHLWGSRQASRRSE